MPYWALPPYGSCTDATAYQLLSVDPHDAGNLATISGFKASNPGLKLILSVGGWNFPSAYFSAMASTPSSRAAFIQSVQQWLATYAADGIDIDWEYPCSPPRTDDVEITCTDFDTVADAGGSCPQDTANIVSLFRELRAALGPGKLITVASQAAKPLEIEMAVAALEPFVDRFHCMTYDYTVSDVTGTPGSMRMAPNAPLYNVQLPGNAQLVNMSINYTVTNYLQAGVPPSKIMVGVALYGHTWYNPGLAPNDAWQSFGNPALVQGECCGPFAQTYGARPGPGSALCGTYMASEIDAAAPQLTFFDNATASNIAYFTSTGADGYTAPGTWITYTGAESAAAIAQYAVDMGLGGVFVFDSSEDIGAVQGAYKLTNLIADTLQQ